LVTTEAGGSATFTVVLSSEPTAGVTIPLSSNDTDEGTAAPASLTFTAANWNQPQTVTVTGVDDDLVDGDVGYTIMVGPAASGDPSYDGFDPADVSVTNSDDDSAGITVDPTTGLVTTEAGGSATFTVVLGSEPIANVTIPLSSNNTDEGTVAPASLIFTAANWNQPQTVTVTGVDDDLVDGDIGYTVLVGPASSVDPTYDGLSAPGLSVTNVDDDEPGTTLAGTKEIDVLDLDARTVSYLITLVNTGDNDQPDDPLSDEFVDILPDALVLTSAIANAGDLSTDLDTNTVRWNGELAAGGSVTIVIDADILATQSGVISNQGQINFDSDGNGDNDSQALTDDPNTLGDADSTTFLFQGVQEPILVPMLGAPGLLLLAGLMLLPGIRRIGTRCPSRC
jgi:hypothetical protein